MADRLYSDEELWGSSSETPAESNTKVYSDEELWGSSEPAPAPAPAQTPPVNESRRRFEERGKREAEMWGSSEPAPVLEEDKSSALGDLEAGIKGAQQVIPGLRATGGVLDMAAGDYGQAQAQSYADELGKIDAELAQIENTPGFRTRPKSQEEADRRPVLEQRYNELRARKSQLTLGAGAGGTEAMTADAQRKFSDGLNTLIEVLPEIAKLSEESAAIPTNPAAKKFFDPKGEGYGEQFSYMWDALASDPTGVTRTAVLRSLPASAPQVLATIVGSIGGPGGAASLGALVGGSTEMGSSVAQYVSEELAKEKVNTNDRAAVEAWALQNTDKLLDIIAKSTKRAGIIAAGGAISGGVTGKLAADAVGDSLLKKGAKAVIGTGTEAVVDSGAEAVAGLATEGEVNLGEVGGEFVGGLGQGAATVSGQMAVEGYKAGRVSERGPAADEEAALNPAPAAPTTPPAVDPAAAQAVTETPVQPVAPKREQLLEIARRRDQRAQAPVTPKVTPETTPEAPAGQSQPVDSPNAAGTEPPTTVGVGSAAPPNPTENLRDIGKMGSAAVDGMYTMLWDKVQKGDTRENGVPSAVLEAAKMVRERGGLKTPEEFRKFAGEVGAVDRGNNFQADMRALVDKYTPSAAPAAETPAAPNEEITANVPAAPTEEVPPSRANFYADSPETIKLQHAALRDPKNDRKVVVYSADTPIKDLPDKPQGKFIVRRTFKIDGVSTIVDFNTAKTNYGEVQKAIRTGKLNELLDLGPYNQQEVAESVAAGAAPVAVTERTPDGTEVKSATGTEETAPEQMQVLEETKSEPENTIVVEDPRQVIEGRRIDPNSLSEEERQRLVAASEPKRRVLLDQSPDAQYARELQAEANEPIVERVKKAAKEIRKGEVYEEPKPKGKNWTKAEKKEREETNTRSNELLQRTAPSEAEREIEFGFMDENVVTKNKARAAIRERAKAMLIGAKTAGLRLPEKVSDNADASMNLSDGAVAAINARDFLAQLKNPDPNKTIDEIYQDFITDDMLLRNGQRDAVLGKRRADNDTRTRADTETAAETTASEAATPEDLVAAKEEGDEVAAEALKREVKVDGPAYTVGRATKAPVVETKKKRTLLKRETVAGEEDFLPLDESVILQTVTFAEALAQAGTVPGSGTNRTVINRMLSRLGKQIGNIKVHVVPQEAIDDMYPGRPAGLTQGYYDTENNYIVLSDMFVATGSFDAQILAHEGTHAYLSLALDLDKTLKQDFQQILDYARSVATNKDAYGLTNVHEMLAEAMSNPEFQNFLMGIKLPKDLASKYDMPGGSMWQLFVEAIRKHLGLGRKDVDALSYVLRLGDRAEARINKMTPRERKFFQQAWAEGLLESQGRQRNYADELKAAGVPDDVAAELDAFIKEELGKAIDPATLSDLIEDFKAEFGQDTSASNDPMPEEEAKEKAKRAKAETEKEAKRMMRDTTKSREELLDEAYLKALDEFRPGRVPKQNSKALLSLLMNNQLALIADNFFGRSTNPVRRIADLIEKRRTGKQRYVEELGAVAQKLYDLERAYRKKDPEAWENFVSLAHDATMAQVHPDKPLDDEIHKYLGSNKALGGKWSKKQHPRLAAVYNSLPGDLQALYRETRDALTATRDRVELGNVSAVLRKMGFNDEALAKRFLDKKSTEADRKLVGDVVADYIENIVRLSAINGPYFNLARQGDIVLTGRYKVTTPSNAKKIEDGVFEFKSRDEAVKFAEEQMLRPTIARVAVDPKTGERFFVDDDGTQVKATFADPSVEERYRVTVQTKYVEFFHSEAAAREKAEALADAVELNDIEPKRFERSAANADMLSDQMRSLASTLDTRLKSANLTPEQKAILKGTLNEASLRFMASTRLQTHRLPRRYVQGASKDLVVSTYQYVDSSAGYLAKLDTQVELEDAMRQMEKATSALSARREGIGGGARAISNEVERRVNDIDYNMDQGLVAGTANRVMSVNFINHLMSPMYTVLQVVQTPLVAGPVLSAEYGAARTSYHLMKASKDIGALQIGLKGIGATAKGVAGVNTPGRAYTDYAKARLNPLERRALDELIKLGVVDADAGFDVARLERKDSKVVRGVDATLEYFSNIARAAPQSVEAINRAVVGLATFRMEAARGTNFKDAVRKAQEAVELTHFNLSASNAAPIFRNPVGRLLLQFKKYGQNIYFLHYYNAARMLRPKVKGDRAKGAKTLLYLAATHQIAAGLVGLPIEPLKIAVLVLGMIPGMPEWEDLEREAEEALAEMMGKSGAEAMMYGLPRLADVDISSRVGLSSLLLFGEPGEMGDKDSVQSWFLNMLIGPTVGSATDIAGGIAAAAEGEGLKAAEKLLPIKVISDTLRAVREVDDGKFNTQDALMRAFGVQSARQARIQQSTGADIDKRSELKREKNAIIKAWISADTASEKAKIIARMREYNKEAGKRDQLSKKFLENIRKKEMKKYEAE